MGGLRIDGQAFPCFTAPAPDAIMNQTEGGIGMVIGVMQASSQREKNALLFEATRTAAAGHEVVNLGVFAEEAVEVSYVETAAAISLMLCAGAIDFAVTGCSSGQGMALALNSLPGVLCGYVPTPQDAYLFGRINGGNAASLPLGLGFGWCGEINLRATLEKLFDGPFGAGYPPEDADRKRRDAALLKRVRREAVRGWPALAPLEPELMRRALGRANVRRFLLERGTDADILRLAREL